MKDPYANEVNRYMNMPMIEWPESLKKTVKSVSDRIGVCGDVFAETIQAWLQAGQDELFYTVEGRFISAAKKKTVKRFQYNATVKVIGVVEAESEYEAKRLISALASENFIGDERMEWDDTNIPYIKEVSE